MLSEKEKHGISEMLSMMSISDLKSLSQTVTNRLLMPETNMEAIDAIILHTEKSLDLLKRKKIKKELLFKYLHRKRITIQANSEKSSYVRKILEVWESSEGHDCGDMDFDNPPEGPPPSRNVSHTSLNSLNVLNSTENGEIVKFHPTNDSNNLNQESKCYTDLTPVNMQTCASNLTKTQCEELAISFAKWYYQLLNSVVDSNSSEWNSSHFWPDASGRVVLMSQNGEVMESAEAFNRAQDVADMISHVFSKHQLKCNPNLCSEGVRGKLSPHGLVAILVCGTLHMGANICGVFEQVFWLAKDLSAENNWKIKRTEARLIGGQDAEIPSITERRLEVLTFS